MDKTSVLVINGPNLNMLGQREPDQYGKMTLEDICRKIKAHGEQKHIPVDFFQSNSEGELVNRIQDAPGRFSGIILNAGAYSHTSIAIRDAVSTISVPVIEVHISNVYNREGFRHHSYLAPVCAGSIVGFGYLSYILALEYFALSCQPRH
ncbi:MAG: type II 3-dehydroquinate dehydratase [Deltaproteobacteria bacterium]|nr:type II 3-dehydroquinate dehydratase [Deltaproteobacteria bacterium]